MPLRLVLAAGLALVTPVWPQSPEGLQAAQAPQLPQSKCADCSCEAVANPLLGQGIEEEEAEEDLVQQVNDACASTAADAKALAEQAAAAMQDVKEEFNLDTRKVKLEYSLAMIKKAQVYREVAYKMARVQSSTAVQAEKAAGVRDLSREKGNAAQSHIEALESKLQAQRMAKSLAQQSAKVQGINPATHQYQALIQGHVQAEQFLKDKLNAALGVREEAAAHVQSSVYAADLAHTAAIAHVRAEKARLVKAQAAHDAYVQEHAARLSQAPPVAGLAAPSVAERAASPVADVVGGNPDDAAEAARAWLMAGAAPAVRQQPVLKTPDWQVPQVLQVPQVPQYPQMPQMPQMSQLPQLPQMPQVPHPQYPQALQTTLDGLSSHRSTLSGLEPPLYAGGVAIPPAISQPRSAPIAQPASTSSTPVGARPPGERRCSAHASCHGLPGDCCPTEQGMFLGCCSAPPEDATQLSPQEEQRLLGIE